MLKRHIVVETGVNQLVNTLAILLNSSETQEKKVMLAARHAAFSVDAINATLSQAHDKPLIGDAERKHAVKTALLSFQSASRTRVDTLLSTDKNNRKYTLANMLERYLLVSAHDGAVNDIAKRAHDEDKHEVYIVKGDAVKIVPIAGTVQQIKKTINQNLPRNPYSSASLSI